MPAATSPVRFPWYDLVEEVELQQGDLIDGCPVLHPSLGAVSGGGEVEVPLAQAFARFFMRVGLPVDIPPFR